MYQRIKLEEDEGYFDQLLKFVDQHLVETEVRANGQINLKKEI